jgi:hypothetical protein
VKEIVQSSCREIRCEKIGGATAIDRATIPS